MRGKINKVLNIILLLLSLSYIIEGAIEIFSTSNLEQGALRIFAGLLILLCLGWKGLYATEQRRHEDTKNVLNQLINALYEEKD